MPRPMSLEEIHTARLLRRESKTVDEIAVMMGRSRAAIGDAVKGLTKVWVHARPVSPLTIPQSVLDERDRRLALAPRDLTAAINGDPLPGMSALERRHGR